jgi:hypothetical protein
LTEKLFLNCELLNNENYDKQVVVGDDPSIIVVWHTTIDEDKINEDEKDKEDKSFTFKLKYKMIPPIVLDDSIHPFHYGIDNYLVYYLQHHDIKLYMAYEDETPLLQMNGLAFLKNEDVLHEIITKFIKLFNDHNIDSLNNNTIYEINDIRYDFNEKIPPGASFDAISEFGRARGRARGRANNRKKYSFNKRKPRKRKNRTYKNWEFCLKKIVGVIK